jgi:PAS domain S-box-containing protein
MLQTFCVPVSALQSMDLEKALEHVNVPSYVIDTSGIIRWLNPAAEKIVGNVRGRQFASVVAPEDTQRARELFARKVVGSERVKTRASRLSTRRAAAWALRSARCRSFATST